MSTSSDDPYYFDEGWTAYFHDPADPDWTTGSYVRLCNVSSTEDYASLRYALKDKVAKGMFFLMREEVFPCWDDAHNIDGGCLSMKLPKTEAPLFWDALCQRVLGGCLTSASASRFHFTTKCDDKGEKEYKQDGEEGDDENECDIINGVSISPKTYFSIVKVWTSREIPATALHLPRGLHGEVLYKPNRDTIRDSQTASSAPGHAPGVPDTA